MERYPKQGTVLKWYDEMVADRVHNAMKHGGDLKKYQLYIRSEDIRRRRMAPRYDRR